MSIELVAKYKELLEGGPITAQSLRDFLDRYPGIPYFDASGTYDPSKWELCKKNIGAMLK